MPARVDASDDWDVVRGRGRGDGGGGGGERKCICIFSHRAFESPQSILSPHASNQFFLSSAGVLFSCRGSHNITTAPTRNEP